MHYSLLAGGKTSEAVEPAVFELATLLTAAADATSATRANATALNKEESILVEMVQSQLSAALNQVPPTWHLYSSHLHALGIYGPSSEPHKGHIGKFATSIADKDASKCSTKILREHVCRCLHTTSVVWGKHQAKKPSRACLFRTCFFFSRLHRSNPAHVLIIPKTSNGMARPLPVIGGPVYHDSDYWFLRCSHGRLLQSFCVSSETVA